ncbi:indolepyruvate ferredoxin oxidoreductase family protein [Nocardioides panacihumi]|uniref:Indolepyruvate ferredoxin oxidoreductase family protein n=1 Tax=Nocardioides panacihumi TaxID=400774 RepID=A0ABN2RUL1_9ACTN
MRARLSGIQALARLPIDQSRRDRQAGRRAGTYISGYEGSPLAGYDLELMRQRSLLDDHQIIFEPGLNEEAAAMAVQGSQLIESLPKRVDGVAGFWYGKAPGLDRASDALRHANLMGTHPQGGVVAFVGDDPAAKSSTVPCASELSLADLGMPTFYPADPGDILTLGRHAVAMSRACGLWTALKIVTSVADGTASVDLDADDFDPVLPAGAGKHRPTAELLQPTLGVLERDLMTTRLRLAREYARLNSVNKVLGGHADTVGIVAAGKTYLDVQEALAKLGLDEDGQRDAGIRILRLGLIWPLDPEEIRAFADGLEEVIVVEEKRSFVESAVREALYATTPLPLVTGKTDVDETALLPSYGELDADSIAVALAKRLAHRDLPTVHEWQQRRAEAMTRERRQLPLLQRTPYFCSGCPHNVSTRSHTDAIVGAGIGCHGMVLMMDRDRVGQVTGLTQMGGEGTQWLGMAPFVEPGHLVQNLGDGTFHHSGSLAIRAAVASGRNVTYRVLYNSAVAMTGGQEAVGKMTVARMVDSLKAEGVSRIIVTTDNVGALRRTRLPRDVKVWPRSRLAEAEQLLSSTPGTTVLIHEQECATELRRKRKRGITRAPRERVAINQRICEGCGDCGSKSNCLSVHPVETEFGRKTEIHQSSCNTDFTCLTGDCPAFVTVRPRRGSQRPPVSRDLDADAFDEPARAGTARDQAIRLMGIGGTGIVTTSQVLATAAVLTGRYVRTLDQTGLAQKGGAVVSDVKISTRPIAASNKIGESECDLYVGYDLLVAADSRNLQVVSPAATAIVSTSIVPTGRMVSDPSVRFPDVAETARRIGSEVEAEGRLIAIDVRCYAEALFGAEQFANMFLVGVAHQSGALDLPAQVIEEAVRLNGVAVDQNIQAFRRGRQYVSARDELEALVKELTAAPSTRDVMPSSVVRAAPGSELERVVSLRRDELVRYQDQRYARRYELLVEDVRRAEHDVDAGSTRLTEAVARNAFKLMAYKDEYEVARLARDAYSRDEVERQFGAGAQVRWQLHPPALRALGVKRKVGVGRWFVPAFAALQAMRRVRGTPLDPFGYARVRKVERRLVSEYAETLARCLERLDVDTYETVRQIAELPDVVRGYEAVKLASVNAYDRRRLELLAEIGLGDAAAPERERDGSISPAPPAGDTTRRQEAK